MIASKCLDRNQQNSQRNSILISFPRKTLSLQRLILRKVEARINLFSAKEIRMMERSLMPRPRVKSKLVKMK